MNAIRASLAVLLCSACLSPAPHAGRADGPGEAPHPFAVAPVTSHSVHTWAVANGERALVVAWSGGVTRARVLDASGAALGFAITLLDRPDLDLQLTPVPRAVLPDAGGGWVIAWGRSDVATSFDWLDRDARVTAHVELHEADAASLASAVMGAVGGRLFAWQRASDPGGGLVLSRHEVTREGRVVGPDSLPVGAALDVQRFVATSRGGAIVGAASGGVFVLAIASDGTVRGTAETIPVTFDQPGFGSIALQISAAVARGDELALEVVRPPACVLPASELIVVHADGSVQHCSNATDFMGDTAWTATARGYAFSRAGTITEIDGSCSVLSSAGPLADGGALVGLPDRTMLVEADAAVTEGDVAIQARDISTSFGSSDVLTLPPTRATIADVQVIHAGTRTLATWEMPDYGAQAAFVGPNGERVGELIALGYLAPQQMTTHGEDFELWSFGISPQLRVIHADGTVATPIALDATLASAYAARVAATDDRVVVTGPSGVSVLDHDGALLSTTSYPGSLADAPTRFLAIASDGTALVLGADGEGVLFDPRTGATSDTVFSLAAIVGPVVIHDAWGAGVSSWTALTSVGPVYVRHVEAGLAVERTDPASDDAPMARGFASDAAVLTATEMPGAGVSLALRAPDGTPLGAATTLAGTQTLGAALLAPDRIVVLYAAGRRDTLSSIVLPID